MRCFGLVGAVASAGGLGSGMVGFGATNDGATTGDKLARSVWAGLAPRLMLVEAAGSAPVQVSCWECSWIDAACSCFSMYSRRAAMLASYSAELLAS